MTNPMSSSSAPELRRGAALELARQGLKVVCLEQGGWNLPDDFTAGKPEWELTRLKQWNSARTSGRTGRLSDRQHRQPGRAADVQRCRRQHHPVLRALGAGDAVGLPGEDLDGVAEDWPFTYEDLRPFYDEVTHHIGASGLEGDPAYPDPHTFPLPRCRSASTAWSRPRDGQAGLALVAGAERHRVAQVQEPGSLPALRRLRIRLPRRRQGQHRYHAPA